ncbi:MAG: hypothetical protein JF600_05050 [Xanthomonadales bacterium]|nr:hypothetical protein [Xanthomonadales bacterium]
MKSRNVACLAVILALSPCIVQAHGDACANPFQTSGSIAIPVNYSGVTAQFAVPAGYRLQIEQGSANMRLPLNTDRADFQIGTTVGGNYAVHNLDVAEGFAASDRKAFGPVTLYADKGSIVRIFISRIATNSPAGSATWAVTGCLYPA